MSKLAMIDEVFTEHLVGASRVDDVIIQGFDEVGSTMELASELVRSEGVSSGSKYVLVARSQNAGKGRAGRSWVSVRDQGLYATFCLSSGGMTPAHWSGFSLAVGVAIRRALRSLGLSVRLKWPNDVVVLADNERGYLKLAGTLIDLQRGAGSEEWLLVGIGLNVRESECIHVVEGTSLEELLEKAPELTNLFGVLLDEVCACYSVYREEGFKPFIEEWREASIMNGSLVSVDGELAGTVRDIDERGGLLVIDADGKETVLYGGEVEVRRVTSN